MEDIGEFEKNYKGLEEEVNDFWLVYLDYEGDMDVILENVLCFMIGDGERF